MLDCGCKQHHDSPEQFLGQMPRMPPRSSWGFLRVHRYNVLAVLVMAIILLLAQSVSHGPWSSLIFKEPLFVIALACVVLFSFWFWGSNRPSIGGLFQAFASIVIAVAAFQTAHYGGLQARHTEVQTRLESLLHRPTIIVDAPKIRTVGGDSFYLSNIGALPAHNVTVQIRFFGSRGDRPKPLGDPIVSHLDHVDPRQEIGVRLNQPSSREDDGQVFMEIAWDYFDSLEDDAKVYRRYEFYVLEPGEWVTLSLRGKLFDAHKEFFGQRRDIFIRTGSLQHAEGRGRSIPEYSSLTRTSN